MKTLLTIFGKLCFALAFTVAIVGYQIIGPRLFDQMIRMKVTEQTFKIYPNPKSKPEHQYMGTGFIIKIPKSEKTLMITNRHVCERSTDNTVLAEQGEFRKTLKIVKVSRHTDLCALEAIPGYKGLDLGTSYDPGDEVIAVGHPTGYPVTKTTGEIIGYEDIIADSKINTKLEEINCKKALNQKVVRVEESKPDTKDGFVLTAAGPAKKLVKHCRSTENHSILTTVMILHGSSGSALTTWTGDVIGVIFANTDLDHWGRAVPLEKLDKFLRTLE